MAKTNKICGQINIPKVDNTPIECDEIISSKCVNADKESIILGLVGTESMYDFLDKLEILFKKQNKELSNLKTQNNRLLQDYKNNLISISKLEARVTKLEKEIIKLKSNGI